MGCFCLFGLKCWEGGRDLRMIFCQSVSTVWVVSTIKGRGDSNVNCYNRFCLKFFSLKGRGCQNIALARSGASTSHLVKLSIPTCNISTSIT